MISMQGVPSALIARNESWVRRQAQSLMRRVPSNVEKADLIQAGLIAVAQAALSFVWDGDRDSEAGREAFVRYARSRVKGAMLDELRQMDHLSRADRRKVKVVQIARERWRAVHGREPGLGELAGVCGMDVDEIAALERADQMGRTESLDDDDEGQGAAQAQAATPAEEVEARVDTAIVMRHLERFFAELPERERLVIDSYLGIGLSPVELAQSLAISPSRVSQLYRSAVGKLAARFGARGRDGDRRAVRSGPEFARLVEQREAALRQQAPDAAWGDLIERILVRNDGRWGGEAESGRIAVRSDTRWG